MIKTYIKNKEQFDSKLAEHGLTATQLALMVDIDRSYLSNIMNGHRPIGRKSAGRIARYLDCDVSDLFVIVDVDKSFTSEKLTE